MIATILGAVGFYQLFFVDFINILGATIPPLTAPILADFFIVGKQKKYDEKLLDKQPAIRWAGVISFVIGAFLGWAFSYNVIPLPSAIPGGLLAFVIAFVIYLAIYKLTPDAKKDVELVAEL